eukprot:Selendium_serpulae@DN5843_c0_g1_i2.p1
MSGLRDMTTKKLGMSLDDVIAADNSSATKKTEKMGVTQATKTEKEKARTMGNENQSYKPVRQRQRDPALRRPGPYSAVLPGVGVTALAGNPRESAAPLLPPPPPWDYGKSSAIFQSPPPFVHRGVIRPVVMSGLRTSGHWVKISNLAPDVGVTTCKTHFYSAGKVLYVDLPKTSAGQNIGYGYGFGLSKG